MDYVITITHVGNGSVSPSGIYTVEEGDTCRIVATPAPGHAVSQVVVTGPEGAVTTPLLTEVILENVESDFSVEFTFVPGTQQTVTVTPSVTGSGSITPASPESVNYGGSLYVSFLPSPGCYLSGILVNGSSVALSNVILLTGLITNTTVAATFTSLNIADATVLVKRGSTDAWAGKTLQYGEIGIDRSRKEVRIGDVRGVEVSFLDALCLNGSGISVASEPPEDPGVSPLWIDSDDSKMYYWGGEWIEISASGSGISVASIAPVEHDETPFWYDYTTRILYYWNEDALEWDVVGPSSGVGGSVPLTPTGRNCLVAWNDSSGVYIKDADYNAFVRNGLFVRTPYGDGEGEYKIKVYGSLDTQTYGGIVDIRKFVGGGSGYDPQNYTIEKPGLGFVCNLIKSEKISEAGGGLIISGIGSDGDYDWGSPDPMVALVIRNRGVATPETGLCIFSDYKVRAPFGIVTPNVNLPVGGTYDVGGVPHNHDSAYLRLSGGELGGGLSMAGNRIAGVGAPINGGDVVTLDYLSSYSANMIWQDPVESIEIAPVEIDGRYLVAAIDTSGDFVGHENEIATRDGGIWSFESPEIGWAVAVDDDGYTYNWNGGSWAKLPGMGSHSSLQGLSNDDHLQYVHVSIPREISAIHTFTAESVPFNVNSAVMVENLNANFLGGLPASYFAAFEHTHEFGYETLVGFDISDPQGGDIFIFDSEIQKFINSALPLVYFDSDHDFVDATERDNYFTLNPDAVSFGMFIVVASTVYQYTQIETSPYHSDAWEERTPIIRGPRGYQGDPGVDGANGTDGAQGIQGPHGIQGPPGAPGTSINLKGSVDTSDDLPGGGNVENDAYYCSADGHCYVWTESLEWVDVGSIVGPQGVQGIQGIQGPPGVAGPVGPRGETGLTGPEGPVGEIGPRGPAGIGDGSWQSTVEEICNAPPENYDYEDRFIVGATPTGDFVGHANEIATWMDTDQWFFEFAPVGAVAYVLSLGTHWKYLGLGIGWEQLDWSTLSETGNVKWVAAPVSVGMVQNTGYVTIGETRIILTLPTVCAVGRTLRVSGRGVGGWKIQQSANQFITYSDKQTVTGVDGYIQSKHYRDCVELLCVVENLEFQVISSIGTLEMSVVV